MDEFAAVSENFIAYFYIRVYLERQIHVVYIIMPCKLDGFAAVNAYFYVCVYLERQLHSVPCR